LKIYIPPGGANGKDKGGAFLWNVFGGVD
jgi:hypothetical protein